MKSEATPAHPDGDRCSSVRAVENPSRRTRRDVVQQGIKLAFVPPVLSTFFAEEARAAGSNQSCYPAGHVCPGAEPCCNGDCNLGVCP